MNMTPTKYQILMFSNAVRINSSAEKIDNIQDASVFRMYDRPHGIRIMPYTTIG
jgi:hypothetical protein